MDTVTPEHGYIGEKYPFLCLFVYERINLSNPKQRGILCLDILEVQDDVYNLSILSLFIKLSIFIFPEILTKFGTNNKCCNQRLQI